MAMPIAPLTLLACAQEDNDPCGVKRRRDEEGDAPIKWVEEKEEKSGESRPTAVCAALCGRKSLDRKSPWLIELL